MGREVRRVPPPYHPQDKEATWFQAWETVTEGTPVTPPFATTDESVDYLATRGDFWDQERGDGPWDRKSAEEFVKAGWAPTLIVTGKRIINRATVAHCRTAPAVRVVVDGRQRTTTTPPS
jgi:hypothetical protein